MKKIIMYGAVALIVFVIDRITKMMALMYCVQTVRVNQLLSFEMHINRGVSWGMFHTATDGVCAIVVVGIMCLTAILCWYAWHKYGNNQSIIAEVLIISASVSNLIDRVIYGGVVDFIIVSYGNLSWPVFNVADVAIVLGVGIMVFWYELEQ
jgi:signal peptidase II